MRLSAKDIEDIKGRAAHWIRWCRPNAARYLIHEVLPQLLAEVERLQALVPAIACPCGEVIDIPVRLRFEDDDKPGAMVYADPDASIMWEHWATKHMGLPSATGLPPRDQ